MGLQIPLQALVLIQMLELHDLYKYIVHKKAENETKYIKIERKMKVK